MPLFYLVLVTCLVSSCVTVPNESANSVYQVRLSTHGNDVAFDTSLVEVPLKPVITLAFVNEADHDSEILHNIAVLRPGSESRVLDAFQKSDYDLELMKKHPDLIVISDELDPGETGTVSFSPDVPGDYPYVCLMPGHADLLGMKGILRVKP
jgi:plastocyanin